MPRNILASMLVVLSAWCAAAQQPAQPSNQPQVKVNVLNVCSPSPADQKEIAAALAKIPQQPLWSNDFEVDRGRSTLDDNSNLLQPVPGAQVSPSSAVATWVRIRREFPPQNLFSTVQYSFSVDPKNLVETMVWRVRDPKDLLQLSIEDSAAAVTAPAAMLATNTPASRIKLERFGKSSIVLARCPAAEGGPDQSAFEPLFQSATAVVSNYRSILGVRALVPEELARTHAAPGSRPKMPVKGTPVRPVGGAR